MTPTDRARVESLLPWYVNGRIADVDRTWLDGLVRTDAEAREALDWHLSVRAVVVTDMESLPPDIGLDELMARVAQENPHGARTAARASRTMSGTGLFDRFAAGIAQAFTPRLAAFATALIAVQAGIIATLMVTAPMQEHATVRSVAPAVATTQAIQLSFRSGTAERDLRMLLTRVGARLADGPSQLGDYVVLVPADRMTQALQELEASGLVEHAAVIDWQPGRPDRELRP